MPHSVITLQKELAKTVRNRLGLKKRAHLYFMICGWAWCMSWPSTCSGVFFLLQKFEAGPKFCANPVMAYLLFLTRARNFEKVSLFSLEPEEFLKTCLT